MNEGWNRPDTPPDTHRLVCVAYKDRWGRNYTSPGFFYDEWKILSSSGFRWSPKERQQDVIAWHELPEFEEGE